MFKTDSSLHRDEPEFLDFNDDCIVSLMPVKGLQRYGIAELSEDGRTVLRTVEEAKEPKLNQTIVGVYILNRSFFKVYPKLKPS